MKSVLFSILILSSSLASARSIKGHYEVPVASELQAFAKYPIECNSDNYSDSPNVMTFSLPKELVGNLRPFTMTRTKANPELWEGENVNGNCTKEGRHLRCEVRFNNLNIDLLEVNDIIQDTFTNPEVLKGKMKIADQFAREGEPIGFIVYKLRGRDRY